MSGGGYYRLVDTSFWSEPFSATAQRVGLWLMTGPRTTQLPGLVAVGRGAIADELELEPEDAAAALRELEGSGWVRADWKARLVWLPGIVQRFPPSSPNVVKGWRKLWRGLPRCALLDEAAEAFSAIIATRGESDEARARFVDAWAEVVGHRGNNCFGNGSGNGSRDHLGDGSGSGSRDGSANRSPNGSRTEDQREDQQEHQKEGEGNPDPERARAQEDEPEEQEQREEQREREPEPEPERERPTAVVTPAPLVLVPRAVEAPTRLPERVGERAAVPAPQLAQAPVVAPGAAALVAAWTRGCAPLPAPTLDPHLEEMLGRAVAADPRRLEPEFWTTVARTVAADSFARGRRWTLRDVLREPGRLEEYVERYVVARAEAQARGEARAAPALPAAVAGPPDPLAARRVELARLEGRAGVGMTLTPEERARLVELRAELAAPAAASEPVVIDRGETRIELDGAQPRTHGRLVARPAAASFAARAN